MPSSFPSHWLFPGHAPNFSRKVARCEAGVDRAKSLLRRMLQQEYPMDHPVKVVHHRGYFFGRVAGWDVHGTRVLVRNDRTGKESKWWAAQVQLDSGAA